MKNVLSLITCTVTVLSYVGVTKNGDDDLNNSLHPLKYGHGTKLKKAVQEHGRENFTVEIIGHSYKTRDELFLAEIKAIADYGTLWPNGYNLTRGGESNFPRSEEFSAYVAKSMKLRWSDRSFRKKQIKALQKRSKNPTYLKNLCRALKAAAQKPEVICNYRVAARKRSQQPHFKEHCSLAIKRLHEDRAFQKRHSEGVKAWWKKRKQQS